MNPILAISISVGFETLRANPLRTILSTLGIVIGVGALVSVLSVGDGMERLARDQIGRTTDLQRISITPIHLDLTSADGLEEVAAWDLEGVV